MGDTASSLARGLWGAPPPPRNPISSKVNKKRNRRSEEIKEAEHASASPQYLKNLERLSRRHPSIYHEPNAHYSYLQPHTPNYVRLKIARNIVGEQERQHRAAQTRRLRLMNLRSAYEEKKDRESEEMQALLKNAVALRIRLVNSQTNRERAELEIESEKLFKKIADLQKELYSQDGGEFRGHLSRTRRSSRWNRRTRRNRISPRRC